MPLAAVLAGALWLAQPAPGPSAGPATDASATAPADVSRQVAELVAQLDAPGKPARDAAERALVELGPAALDALPAADAPLSAEQRLRLDRVRQKLTAARAEQSVQASRVTFAGRGVPISRVLDEIRRQTKNPLVDARERFGQEVIDAPCTVDWRDVPFWEALDDALDQAGLAVYDANGREGLSLVARPPMSGKRRGPQVRYVGAFRLEVTELLARRNLNDPAQGSLDVDVDVFWEPRLAPIVLFQRHASAVAETDDGQSLSVPRGGDIEIPLDAFRKEVSLKFSFARPRAGATALAVFRGQLNLLLPGRTETFRFDKLGEPNPVSERRGPVTVVVESATKPNKIWQIRMRAVFDRAAGALESHRTWVFQNEAWLETPAGEKLEVGGLETTRQTDTDVGLVYMFTGPETLAGHTFVYQTPAAIVSVPVDFAFTNLELP